MNWYFDRMSVAYPDVISAAIAILVVSGN